MSDSETYDSDTHYCSENEIDSNSNLENESDIVTASSENDELISDDDTEFNSSLQNESAIVIESSENDELISDINTELNSNLENEFFMEIELIENNESIQDLTGELNSSLETELIENNESVSDFTAELNSVTPQETQCHEACMKLNKIFSNIDPEVIKRIYIRQANDTNLKNEDLLNAVVEEILNKETNRNQFEMSMDVQESKNETFEATAFSGTEELENNALETNEEDENENEEETEFEPFDVEQFLIVKPNAVEYFENPARKCEYSPTMFELLKNYFRKLTVSTITEEYTKKGFNAVKTFQLLKIMNNEIKINREKTKIEAENLQAMFEFNYIIHRESIHDFIAQQIDREEIILQMMRENEEQLECECCYEKINSSSKLAITCQEGHVFCNRCAILGTNTELAKGCPRIKCFQECNSEFNLNSLQKILTPDKFKILLSKVQEGEIAAAKIEGLVSCPFCYYASIPPENDKIFTCMNLDCGKKSCRLCKKLDHSPKECERIEKNKKARLILEEKMTAALVRKCRCGKEIIKDGGCNVVTCSCGESFCYFCGKSGITHDHISRGCGTPITANTDASNVVYVAQKIKNELLKIDPNLEINMDSILPTVHHNSHTTIVSTHALTESSTLPEL
ncbi:putative leucine-rich repeat-containing protein DDB_G0290503 [Leptopilina boulardi]|uniref:putative leucine-rich repeat-containing protein DDB_G0290503 n=1 Tax=Leptopilina boulardi TaxID=63433 RepID=UPI0021F55CEA|nr:putative leucine-rich repeat-containing protein DDB_G0290503 [Leptopilina boulardi]